MDDIDINDIRTLNKFKSQTFSGYKLSEVKIAFITQLKNENINASLFWCFELLCSGNIFAIWDIFITFIGQYTSISNPKLIIYISAKIKEFDNLLYHFGLPNIIDLIIMFIILQIMKLTLRKFKN